MKFKHHAEVWSLLRQNISKGQLIGYVIANVIGLTVILIGVLFYCDSRNNSASDDLLFSNDYVVLSKKVDGIGFAPTYFSEQEIELLGRETWVMKVGRFTSSRFAVNGSVDVGGKRLSTYLFLESVPDEFFDVKPKGWSFSPADKFVPVILCKDYLTLYNFGFAVPQGLPQVSEDIISSMPMTLRLTGEKMQTEFFDASIVGFSSRLNTIAVPQDFMDWANERYSAPEADDTGTSRLIVKVDWLASAGMKDFLERHEIEIAGDKAESGNISSFLSVVSAVVTANGFVICLLAMFILILSIFLILQKSREKLRNLMLLGYSPAYIACYYEAMVMVSNFTITAVSLTLTLSLRPLWAGALADIGLGQASLLPTLAFALIYLVGVTAFDLYIIRNRLMHIWRES